jgi:small subunit ribosomal protein S20
MANTRSASKRARQTVKRSERNRAVLSRLRNLQKRTASEPGKMSELVSAIDKAAKRGMIHRNAARRRKARLAKLAAKK